VNALKSAEGFELAACAARSTENAEKFASTHGIGVAYDSYEKLVEDANVDLVYVSTIHHLHHEHALLCLQAGKNVLVEKPIALTQAHALELAIAAKERGLFLMEGMWTRFFPVVRQARAIISAGEIGEVKSIHSDFGFVLDAESRPHMVDVAQGGGGLMEIGCYPIAAALDALGNDGSLKIAAAGHVVDGVDLSAGITLCGTEGAMAVLTYTLHAQTPEETLVVGTKGYIRIHSPAHCPTRITVTKIGGRESSTGETFEVPLPPPHPTACLGPGEVSASSCPVPYSMFHYPNSMGMLYEAEAVMDCIRAGQLECSEYTVADSLEVMRICDETRRQVGVVWPGEAE
jgi:dihydrodiol dehydrogenase / D-xylose 1-dehydrogenase (NADP)